MSLEDLANRLRIKEELRLQDKSKEHVSKILVIEDGGSSQGKKWKQEEVIQGQQQGQQEGECGLLRMQQTWP